MGVPNDPWEIAERVLAAYPGGEEAFWLAWRLGHLDPPVCEWFRRHAVEVALEAEVAEADRCLEAREAADPRPPTDDPGSASLSLRQRRERRMALEALASAVEHRGTVTRLALSKKQADRRSLRQQLASILFSLLTEDLEIDPSSWAGRSEAAVGTELLRLVSPELLDSDALGEAEAASNLPSFGEVIRWLDGFRQRYEEKAAVDDHERGLRSLAGRLLIRWGDGYRYEPSFRDFLRSRLLGHARVLGWVTRPRASGGRFDDLDQAFATLTRRRLAALLAPVAWPEVHEWLFVDQDLIAQAQ